jgi:GDP-4-dehydro-6-deoxy-D-mannose reductase
VTGASGFVGGWLVPLLRSRGDEVIATRAPAEPPPAVDPDALSVEVGDRDEVVTLVKEVAPDRIVHLAAIASPPEAGRAPLDALRVNYGGTDALLEGIRRFAPATRLLNVGTGAAYGAGPVERPPFEEKDPLRPDSVYAASKAAAEQRCLLAAEREGLDVVSVRPFNHTGPRRPPTYVESALARQLVRIERGEQEPVLRVGNMEDRRDFSDVRDVVEAYALLLDRGERGTVYNVCSGEGLAVRELLDLLLELTPARPEVERDPSVYRPSSPEHRSLVGNPSRLRALGWSPRYELRKTLRDLLDYWREA